MYELYIVGIDLYKQRIKMNREKNWAQKYLREKTPLKKIKNYGERKLH